MAHWKLIASILHRRFHIMRKTPKLIRRLLEIHRHKVQNCTVLRRDILLFVSLFALQHKTPCTFCRQIVVIIVTMAEYDQ